MVVNDGLGKHSWHILRYISSYCPERLKKTVKQFLLLCLSVDLTCFRAQISIPEYNALRVRWKTYNRFSSKSRFAATVPSLLLLRTKRASNKNCLRTYLVFLTGKAENLYFDAEFRIKLTVWCLPSSPGLCTEVEIYTNGGHSPPTN